MSAFHAAAGIKELLSFKERPERGALPGLAPVGARGIESSRPNISIADTRKLALALNAAQNLEATRFLGGDCFLEGKLLRLLVGVVERDARDVHAGKATWVVGNWQRYLSGCYFRFTRSDEAHGELSPSLLVVLGAVALEGLARGLTIQHVDSVTDGSAFP